MPDTFAEHVKIIIYATALQRMVRFTIHEFFLNLSTDLIAELHTAKQQDVYNNVPFQGFCFFDSITFLTQKEALKAPLL